MTWQPSRRLPGGRAAEHERLIRIVEDAFNNNGTAESSFYEQIIGPTWALHWSPGGGHPDDARIRGIELDDYRRAFPDCQFEVEDLVSERDALAIVWVMRGTHEGEWLGVPPTGRPVAMRGMHLFRRHDGQPVEIWAVIDHLDLLLQLGVPLPGPETVQLAARR